MIAIARLTDPAAMREIRLEALRLHPEAFCADLESEEAMSLAEFAKRAENAVWLGGYADGLLAGTAVFSQSARKKRAQIGELGGMYVRAAHRRTGLADALVQAVIEHASGRVELLELGVNAENASAIALYVRHGFQEFGRRPRAIRVNGRDYDELLMIRAG